MHDITCDMIICLYIAIVTVLHAPMSVECNIIIIVWAGTRSLARWFLPPPGLVDVQWGWGEPVRKVVSA